MHSSTCSELEAEFSLLLNRAEYHNYVKKLDLCGLEWLFNFRLTELFSHLRPLEDFPHDTPFTKRVEFLALATKALMEASEDFHNFYEEFLNRGDTEAAMAALGMEMLSTWEAGRDFKNLVKLTKEAEGLLENPEISSLSKAFLMLLTGWSEIIGPQGNMIKVHGWLDSIYQCAEEAESSSLVLMHGVLAGHISFWRGDLAAAEIILEDAKPYAMDPKVSPFTKVQYLSTYGLLKTFQGQPNIAKVMLKPLLEDSYMNVLPLSTWLFMHGNYLYTVASLTDRKEVDRISAIMRKRGIPARNHYNNSYLHFDLAAAELALGRPHKALLHGLECKKRGEQCGSKNVARMSALVIGQALSDLEKDKEALEHFSKWMVRWEEAGYNLIASLGAVEMAYIYLRNGKTEKAREKMEWASRLIPKNEKIPCLYRQSGFVNDIKLKLGLMVPAEIKSVSKPIEIISLGDFLVKVNGIPIEKEQWRGVQPQVLLKAIIALDEGNGVSIEQLSSKLWPDSDGDLAMNTFKVTLWRLRHCIMGSDKALRGWIFVKQRFVYLSSSLCFVDALQFKHLVYKAFSENSSVKTLEKIAALYRGNFINDFDDHPWILKKREQLRSLYIKCIEQIYEHYSESKEFEKAISIINRALHFDPLNELLYLRLMESHVALNNNAKALEVYYTAERLLKKELGARPSALISKMASRIKSKMMK